MRKQSDAENSVPETIPEANLLTHGPGNLYLSQETAIYIAICYFPICQPPLRLRHSDRNGSFNSVGVCMSSIWPSVMVSR